jgi:RNA polymerase primary sigma factor
VVVAEQQLRPETRSERSEAAWSLLDGSVAELMTELDPRERFIIRARYGFEELGDKPTFQRLGEQLGVSKERVRQLEQRALEKLRAKAESLHLRFPLGNDE